jgi:hypothetical protein
LAGAVTVTFNTTTDTPEAGTPPLPVTCNATVRPAATATFGAPSPMRVSNNRDEASDVNPPAVTTPVFTAAVGKAAEAAPAGSAIVVSAHAVTANTVRATRKRFITVRPSTQ